MEGYKVYGGVFVALRTSRAPGRVKPKGWTWTHDGRCAMPADPGRCAIVRSAKAARRVAMGEVCPIVWRGKE